MSCVWHQPKGSIWCKPRTAHLLVHTVHRLGGLGGSNTHLHLKTQGSTWYGKQAKTHWNYAGSELDLLTPWNLLPMSTLSDVSLRCSDMRRYCRQETGPCASVQQLRMDSHFMFLNLDGLILHFSAERARDSWFVHSFCISNVCANHWECRFCSWIGPHLPCRTTPPIFNHPTILAHASPHGHILVTVVCRDMV